MTQSSLICSSHKLILFVEIIIKKKTFSIKMIEDVGCQNPKLCKQGWNG